MQSQSVENIFARAWTLLTKNPVILFPGIAVGVVLGIVTWIVTPHFDRSDPTAISANLVAIGISSALVAAIGIIGQIVNQAYTIGMAGAAWERGSTTIADGTLAFSEDAGRVFLTILLIAAVGIVAGVLTLGLGWLVVLYFTLYAIPAVVLDRMGAIDGIKVSFSIATKRVASTLIIIALLFVIGLAVTLLSIPLAAIPFLGPIVSDVITQCVVAYAALVVVGEYLVTRRAPDIIPPTGTAL